jgi:hypothetical protein
VVVVVVGFLTDNITTPTKIVLSCFGLLVALWQCFKGGLPVLFREFPE